MSDDFIGKKFGLLVVVASYPSNAQGRRWRCKCDCGRERIAHTKHLINGRVSMCAIANHSESLVGKKFGKLTVVRLSHSDPIYGRMWECECECGGARTACTGSLKNGTIKICSRRNHLDDLTGRKFGRLKVLSLHSVVGDGLTKWTCKCECGNIHIAHRASLLSGHSKDCSGRRIKCKFSTTGQHVTTHGLCSVPEYVVWQMMRQRCRNKKSSAYPNYGARGIEVCDRWEDFAVFYADMGPRPTAKHSIDRFPDVNGNYEPSNCRWADDTEQAMNKRNNNRITIGGITRCNMEWSRIIGIHPNTLNWRVKMGKSDAEIMMPPHR